MKCKTFSFCHLWFGDTAIAAGTGNNLYERPIGNFNAIKGYWEQLFAIVAGDANRLTAGTVLEDRNAEVHLHCRNSMQLIRLIKL